jgi:hypothetical protein
LGLEKILKLLEIRQNPLVNNFRKSEKTECSFKSKKLIPKLGKSFEMASSWLKWLHLGGFSANSAYRWIRRHKLAFNLSITSYEQEIFAKQFLVVNLPGTFDMVAAISAQGSHFETFAQLRGSVSY